MSSTIIDNDQSPETVAQTCCDNTWEEAYRRFETPQEETAKFVKRFRSFAAEQWPRDAQIVELFCGRGGGLVALQQLGFHHLTGVDLSADLLGQYSGPAHCQVADCRELPLESNRFDFVVIQGGLHHLPQLPDDLGRVLCEASRILAPSGRIVVVEPWWTPFLRFVHFMCDRSIARRAWPKLDALAIMTEHEYDTYFNWLSRPEELLSVFGQHFIVEKQRVAWGKLFFMGRKKTS